MFFFLLFLGDVNLTEIACRKAITNIFRETKLSMGQENPITEQTMFWANHYVLTGVVLIRHTQEEHGDDWFDLEKTYQAAWSLIRENLA